LGNDGRHCVSEGGCVSGILIKLGGLYLDVLGLADADFPILIYYLRKCTGYFGVGLLAG
jgi:hypothetical protein